MFYKSRLKIEGTPFAGMLLEAGGEALMDRAARMAADTALANGGEQVLLEGLTVEGGPGGADREVLVHHGRPLARSASPSDHRA